jgi:uncharacterized protein (DUF433 family)
MVSVSINHIEIRAGQPVIAGTRITVHDIANMHVHNGSPVEWIVANFDVTPDQIYAALAYYYVHKEQIDRELQEGDALAEEIGTPLADVIARLQARQRQDPE